MHLGLGSAKSQCTPCSMLGEISRTSHMQQAAFTSARPWNSCACVPRGKSACKRELGAKDMSCSLIKHKTYTPAELDKVQGGSVRKCWT